MDNENNKDIANSLNKYTDYAHKGTNFILDSAENINKWYAEQLNKITESDVDVSRIETGVDNTTESEENANSGKEKIFTKVSEYNEVQTNEGSDNSNIVKSNKIQTASNNPNELAENNEKEITLNKNNGKLNTSQKISTAIKGVKLINNSTQRMIRTGKDISSGLSENGIVAFKSTSSRIMTKPIKKATNKVVSKATNKITKVGKKSIKKVAKTTSNTIVTTTKLVTKMVEDSVKLLLDMLPSIVPVIIIIVIVATLGSFLNFSSIDDADDVNFDTVSEMMIEIDDENLQAIYNEFLKNMGKTYLMDHSNLSYDTCMDYYDCSSWVIHCLAHTGIKTIPDTTASGLYNEYCNPVDVNSRQAGDLIFLKDTYDTDAEDGISHVGIYMGELTINGETAEWIIDTGGNPEGVKISKYNNGWWNGENFYGFGRLK